MMNSIPFETTAQHKAYGEIKEGILTLRLRPLAHLNAGTLAVELKMSRTPVREALVRLEQDGLVCRGPAGGFQVRPMRFKEIEDVYRVREALEVEAALEALPHIDDAKLAALAKILKESKALLKPSKIAEFVATSRKFHAAIAKASGNEIFDKIMEPVSDRVRIVGAMLIELHAARQSEVFEENEQIYLALKAREPKLVEEAVRNHIRQARQRAMALLTRDQGQLYIGTIATNAAMPA